jgi:hypothetical protein
VSAADVVGIFPEGEEKPFDGMPIVGRLSVHLGGGRTEGTPIVRDEGGALRFGDGCYAVHDRISDVMMGWAKPASKEAISAQYEAWEQQVLDQIRWGKRTGVNKGFGWEYVPVVPDPPTYEEKAKAAAKAAKVWYAKDTPAKRAFAYELAGDKAKASELAHAAGARGMSEYCCGE